MRHGRAKATRKTLQFYQRTAGLDNTTAYSILVDGTFVVACLKAKMPISERLEKLLCHHKRQKKRRLVHHHHHHSEASSHDRKRKNDSSSQQQSQLLHFYMTNQSLRELEQLQQHHASTSEDDGPGALLRQAVQWTRQNCRSILPDSIAVAEVEDESTAVENKKGSSTSSSVPSRKNVGSRRTQHQLKEQLSVAGKDILHRLTDAKATILDSDAPTAKKTCYFLASQDETLLACVRRQAPLVPILRLVGGGGGQKREGTPNVLILEPPNKTALEQAWNQERTKWTPHGDEEEFGGEEVDERNDSVVEHQQRRKRKAKGPNPLSVKKKKPTSDSQSAAPPNKKRRRRRKSGKQGSGEGSSEQT